MLSERGAMARSAVHGTPRSPASKSDTAGPATCPDDVRPHITTSFPAPSAHNAVASICGAGVAVVVTCFHARGSAAATDTHLHVRHGRHPPLKRHTARTHSYPEPTCRSPRHSTRSRDRQRPRTCWKQRRRWSSGTASAARRTRTSASSSCTKLRAAPEHNQTTHTSNTVSTHAQHWCCMGRAPPRSPRESTPLV